MNRSQEFVHRVGLLRELMQARGLQALVLSRHSNVAWLSAGARTYVNMGAETGEAWVVLTPSGEFLLTPNNESERLLTEEFNELPLQLVSYPWWKGPSTTLQRLLGGLEKIGADAPLREIPNCVDVNGALLEVRSRLTALDQEKLRRLGRTVGQVLSGVARVISPGETEYEITGRLAQALAAKGIELPVWLVGVDERVFRWRHFLPTDARLQRYAALVVCARQDGLMVAATRLVHFGQPSPDLWRRLSAVQRIDAELIAATRPGITASELFAIARDAYAAAGFPDEWRNHHQGGKIGYAPREWLIRPEGDQVVGVGEAYAWNPTVPGAKSEDTILVGPSGNEIVTDSGDFPYEEVTTSRGKIRRPSFLVREV